jgi:hypothetical protein
MRTHIRRAGLTLALTLPVTSAPGQMPDAGPDVARANQTAASRVPGATGVDVPTQVVSAEASTSPAASSGGNMAARRWRGSPVRATCASIADVKARYADRRRATSPADRQRRSAGAMKLPSRPGAQPALAMGWFLACDRCAKTHRRTNGTTDQCATALHDQPS